MQGVAMSASAFRHDKFSHYGRDRALDAETT
jgi:hypothetical protein